MKSYAVRVVIALVVCVAALAAMSLVLATSANASVICTNCVAFDDLTDTVSVYSDQPLIGPQTVDENATGFVSVDLGTVSFTKKYFLTEPSLSAIDGFSDYLNLQYNADGKQLAYLFISDSETLLPASLFSQGCGANICSILPENGDWQTLFGAPGKFQVLVRSDVADATVPEPTTLALFGAGLAGAVAMRRRKKAA
jgi:hypothetical protein